MHSIVVWSELNAQAFLSQRSLQPEPIFRLLLKVAVDRTLKCDSNLFQRSMNLAATVSIFLPKV